MGFSKMYILSLCPWNFTYTVLFSSFLLKWSFNWLYYSRVTVKFSPVFQDIISSFSLLSLHIQRVQNFIYHGKLWIKLFWILSPRILSVPPSETQKIFYWLFIFFSLYVDIFITLKSFLLTISMHSFLGYFCFLSCG